MKGLDSKFMGKLGRNPSLKCNISSSNQVRTINEAPLDSTGFFDKIIAHFFEFVENCCHYEYLKIFFLKI